MIHSPLNAPEVVLRALTFANSEPKGPVYLSAMRETMEEHHSEASMRRHIPTNLNKWSIVRPGAIHQADVDFIANSLLHARNPVIITGSLGRNTQAVSRLVKLADTVAVSVIQSAPSSVCFPATHIGHAGYQFGPSPIRDLIPTADVILILDADIPWIPKFDTPDKDCTVIHIDRDALKIRQNYFHYPVDRLFQADTNVALEQINEALLSSSSLLDASSAIQSQISVRKSLHTKRRKDLNADLDNSSAIPLDMEATASLTVPRIVDAFRDHFPRQTLYLNEAITNYPKVWDHLRAEEADSVLSSGASSLGWGLGAAIGAQIALEEQGLDKKRPIVLFSGDGSFLFGIPSVSFWISRRYKKPFVTVIFNNGGWNAPKKSLLGVYNAKEQQEASLESLHLSFGGDDNDATPDYGGIAKASGGAKCYKVAKYSQLQEAVQGALEVVVKEGKSVVLDCFVPRS
jgi:acetolactate synthase-1/2/3 large subunit